MTVGSQDAVRVLIVDDNRITVENVSRLLNFEPGIEVVGAASSGREGIRKAQELDPDVVLMDINMPDMDGIEACHLLTQSSPRTRVMMMSVQGDLAYLKGAMAAGAREFLIKPFDYDELIASIRRVHEIEPSALELAWSAPKGEPRVTDKPAAEEAAEGAVVVAVFGPKGGVGCSTIAVNLAVALSGNRGGDVLLMDGDLIFGDLDVLLDLRPVHRIVDVLELFDPEDLDVVQRMLAAHESGVRLLAAPSRPEMAELVQSEPVVSLLGALRQTSDFIVIDLGSRYNELSQRVLDLADRVVLLLTPEITAIKSVHLLLMMRGLRSSPPEKVILLMNKYDSTWGITPAAVGDAVGWPVTITVPADGVTAIEAANRGEPVLLCAPRSAMARQLAALERLVPDRQRLGADQPEVARGRRKRPPAPVVAVPIRGRSAAVTAETTEGPQGPGCLRWVRRLARGRTI